jgi:hypothetical protein
MNAKLNQMICTIGPFVMLIILLLVLKKLTTMNFAERFVSEDPVPCEKTGASCAPCDGAPEGKCIEYRSPGWENSVSADVTAPRWTGGDADGECRVFKRKNYYGYGVCNSYAYGEPYYQRCVKY